MLQKNSIVGIVINSSSDDSHILTMEELVKY